MTELVFDILLCQSNLERNALPATASRVAIRESTIIVVIRQCPARIELVAFLLCSQHSPLLERLDFQYEAG